MLKHVDSSLTTQKAGTSMNSCKVALEILTACQANARKHQIFVELEKAPVLPAVGAVVGCRSFPILLTTWLVVVLRCLTPTKRLITLALSWCLFNGHISIPFSFGLEFACLWGGPRCKKHGSSLLSPTQTVKKNVSRSSHYDIQCHNKTIHWFWRNNSVRRTTSQKHHCNKSFGLPGERQGHKETNTPNRENCVWSIFDWLWQRCFGYKHQVADVSPPTSFPKPEVVIAEFLIAGLWHGCSIQHAPNTNKAPTSKEAVHWKMKEQKEWYHVAKMNTSSSLGPFMNEDMQLFM